MTADKPENAPTTEDTAPAGERPRADAAAEDSPSKETGTAVARKDAPPGSDLATKEAQKQPTPRDQKGPETSRQTRIGAAFVALAIGLVVLVLLLIFILQNNEPTTVKYFTARGQMPLGVLMLFAAAGGALLVVVLGTARIIQLHWLARMDRRSVRKKP